jgi:hypothetical protein
MFGRQYLGFPFRAFSRIVTASNWIQLFVRKVLLALLRFPVDLYGVCRDPPRAYDIYICLDVTFDQFNIRYNEPMNWKGR